MKKTFTSMIMSAIVIIILTSAGCKSYMKMKYGMTEPQEETPESLVAFLERHQFPAGNIYMFSDSAAYFRLMRNPLFIKRYLSHLNFDRRGALMAWDSAGCQWAGYDAIAGLRSDTSYRTTEGLTLPGILNAITPLGKMTCLDKIIPDPDFTVVVTWAKFIGGYNYRLFALGEAVRENRHARVRLIWLNVDIQKSWHVPKSQQISIRQ